MVLLTGVENIPRGRAKDFTMIRPGSILHGWTCGDADNGVLGGGLGGGVIQDVFAMVVVDVGRP